MGECLRWIFARRPGPKAGWRDGLAREIVPNFFSGAWYYVYILHSDKDGKLYTGYTENLELRFEQHQLGRVPSTKERRPLRLIYFEACLSQADALHRKVPQNSLWQNVLKEPAQIVFHGPGVWKHLWALIFFVLFASRQKGQKKK